MAWHDPGLLILIPEVRCWNSPFVYTLFARIHLLLYGLIPPIHLPVLYISAMPVDNTVAPYLC